MDLRVQTSETAMNLVGVGPEDRLGLADEQRVAPGAPERSAAWQRMQRRDTDGAMPPLASRHVDDAGVALIAAWIRSL